MNKSLLTSAIVLSLAAAFAGCIGAQPGKPIVTYERDSNTVPKLAAVSQKGMYKLYPGEGTDPFVAVYLNPGDKFGFTNEDGKVVGTYVHAGETKTVPLNAVLDSEYVWKYQGDKKP